MTAAIMAHADSNFIFSFQKLFRHFLLLRQRRYEEDEDDDEEEDPVDENNPREEELQLFDNLRTLGWIRKEGMLQKPLGEALHHTLLNWVKTTISKEFEQEGLFEQVQDYKDKVVLPWLLDLVGPVALEADDWPSRIEFSAAECYCLIRMEEIFELVAEYPDSHPAVLELKIVLERTKMHPALGKP